MAKVLTYVSSYTYDTLLNIMYPDEHAIERSLQEVERLIIQGHTVEYRFGNNMSTVLDMDRFNEFVRPKYADEDEPRVNIQENSFQKTLDELVPKAPEINIVPKVEDQTVLSETINLQPFKPFIPESVDSDGDIVKTNNDIPEGTEVNDTKVEAVKENKEETVEEQKETEQSVAEEENSTEEDTDDKKKNKKSGKK